MKPSAELALLAERELDRLCAAFPLGYRPALEWRPYRTTAGMAYYRRRAIGLGAAVLTTPERLVDTLIHEYAHLLAFMRHGPRGADHGSSHIPGGAAPNLGAAVMNGFMDRWETHAAPGGDTSGTLFDPPQQPSGVDGGRRRPDQRRKAAIAGAATVAALGIAGAALWVRRRTGSETQ